MRGGIRAGWAKNRDSMAFAPDLDALAAMTERPGVERLHDILGFELLPFLQETAGEAEDSENGHRRAREGKKAVTRRLPLGCRSQPKPGNEGRSVAKSGCPLSAATPA